MDKVVDHFTLNYPRQSQAFKLKYLMGLQTQEICKSPQMLAGNQKYRYKELVLALLESVDLFLLTG